MHEFTMLGGIGLTGETGDELDALLRQPKRIALLAYLALPKPGTWHRRDSLLVTFWSEHDDTRARTALRSALYSLRRHLSDGAIRTRGDDDVSLDPALVTTDVAAMLDDLAAGNNREALERYRGELLPGLHIDGAEGFEKWLTQERRRLLGLARKAATNLAEEYEQSRDISAAVDAARRASELDPDDEAAARRWIALLDKAGDRAQAFAVYEKFRKHMAEEFGTRPSAETIALVDAVRMRRDVTAAGPTASPALPVAAAPPVAPEAPRVAPDSSMASEPSPEPIVTEKREVRSRSKWVWAVAAVALLIAVGAWTALRGRDEANASVVSRSLVVLPSENETGDSGLDYIGAGIAEGVARRLEGIGGLKIRSGARSDWPSNTRHDYKTISKEFGSTILLRTTIGKVGDSLEVRAAVVDAKSSGERLIGSRRFATSQLQDVESKLAADVAGEVFRVPVTELPRALTHPVNPESYRLMMEGWHELLGLRSSRGGQQAFQRATEIDPMNARAWAGLSSAWAVQSLAEIPFDVGYDRSAAAAARALALDSLQSSAWANLAILRALKYRSRSVGLELMKKAVAAEPGNPEIFLIKSTIYRHSHDWNNALDAIRVARAMDPLNPVYAEREAFVYLCADRPDIALKYYRSMTETYPTFPGGEAGVIRSLARLGRYDEAISEWRAHVDPDDRELVAALSNAKGERGFWDAKHIEGRRALAALLKEKGGGYISPLRLLQARFVAGDIEGGFRDLESYVSAKDQRAYHLVCSPGIDEVRGTARAKALIARAGALPP